MRRVVALVLAGLIAVVTGSVARASGDVVKIGVLNDQTGMNADLSGQGSVVAARMAVEDFGGTVLGKKIEVIFADHQNKADIGSSIATQWYDKDGVDMIIDMPFSSVALAVQDIAKQRQKVVIFSGPGSSDITGKACSPFGFHWTFDTVALARGTGSAIVKNGGKSWYFLTSDYAFGHALAKDTMAVVKANGGTVLGEAVHPVNSSDFSSYLVQAQASGAQVLGLANGATDTTNSIKQASEFGLTKSGMKLAGLLVFITDVHSLGLPVAQGLQLTESFYWDQNDETRAFAKRYAEKMNGRMPSMVHAGVYSGVLHYLRAIKAANSIEGSAVAPKMHEMHIDDFMGHDVPIRIDGRVLRDFYLFEVKSPAESKGQWDYYKLIRRIPAEDAVRPLAEGGCPLVK